MRLLCVGGKANAFECLDKDVESLLEELSIPRCNVAIVDIKYGKELFNLGCQFAVQVVK